MMEEYFGCTKCDGGDFTLLKLSGLRCNDCGKVHTKEDLLKFWNVTQGE